MKGALFEVKEELFEVKGALFQLKEALSEANVDVETGWERFKLTEAAGF